MSRAPDADGYIQLIRGLQKGCADFSWHRVPYLGQKAPVLVEALDVLLSYLERAATCHSGCPGGDHRVEFLVGRVASSCQAALLMMSSGYYDEALSIIRSLGEITNLMAMFVAAGSQFERWKTLDDKSRRRNFTPVKVRLWLEKNGAVLAIDERRYATLSSYAVHASPNSLPQAHGQHGNAVIGPFYQETGFLLCLNELARPMAFIGVFSAKLIGMTDEIRTAVNDVSRTLVENIGAISVDATGRPWLNPN